MKGIDANTGKSLSGIDHLRQSVRDILTTPLGSRVMRRDYGSRLYQLIDAPQNRSTIMELYAATVEALHRWEPRFRVATVNVTSASPGEIELSVSGIYLPDGTQVTVDGIVVT